MHRQRRQRIVALVSHAGRVDGSVGGHGNRRDLALWRLEEHVALALRVDPVDQSRSVGAGNQIALGVPRQRPNVLLIALEKSLGLGGGLGGINAIHSSRSARGDIQPPRFVEGQIPDVMRLRVRLVAGRFAVGCVCAVERGCVEDHRGARFILLGCGVGLQPVDLAAGQRGRVKRPVRSQPHHLHAQVFRFEEREGLAVLPYVQHRRRRGGSYVGVADLVRGHRPHIGRGRGEHFAQARPLAQVAVAGQLNSLRRALLKLLEPRLAPKVRALRQGRLRRGNGGSDDRGKGGKTPCGAEADKCIFEDKHAAVKSTKVCWTHGRSQTEAGKPRGSRSKFGERE